jgi:hypothetical protein
VSAPTKGMHDFDHVAIGEQVFGMAAAGDDLAVHLHSDPALDQALGDQQVGEGGGGVQGEELAVESDIHPRIVARVAAVCPAPVDRPSPRRACHT